jgi:hypothetical protein
MSLQIKKWIAALWLVLLLTAVFTIFWYSELVYALPTAVPANYKVGQAGKFIPLNGKLDFKNDRPVFLHFFNPECPCSRFNIDHFKTLVKTYHNQVNFAIVLLASRPYTEKEIQQRFGIDVPVVADTTLAASTGVYSTPQAVILSKNNSLYYRGNYNKTRYCTDKKTSYASIAIEKLLHKNSLLTFDRSAFTAYGCTLPSCNK